MVVCPSVTESNWGKIHLTAPPSPEEALSLDVSSELHLVLWNIISHSDTRSKQQTLC
jgi:hypothetical protein